MWARWRSAIARLVVVGALTISATAVDPSLSVAQPDPTFEVPNPAMFVARDDDTTIYVLGTIHIVPCVPDTDPPVCASGITPLIREAIAASEEVWLEIIGVRDVFADAMAIISDIAFFRDGKGLSDFVPRNDLETIAEEIIRRLEGTASVDSFIENIDFMMPWAITLMLESADASPTDEAVAFGGVDAEVEEIANALGTPVFGFEAAAEQAAFLASDPLEYQVAELRAHAVLLRHGANSAAVNQITVEYLWNIWSEARLDEFEPLLRTNFDLMTELSDPEMAAALGLTEAEYAHAAEEIEAFYPRAMQEERLSFSHRFVAQRNQNWMADIEGMLDRPGTFFIAVGAAHLVGEFGLPVLLENAGATVERVR